MVVCSFFQQGRCKFGGLYPLDITNNWVLTAVQTAASLSILGAPLPAHRAIGLALFLEASEVSATECSFLSEAIGGKSDVVKTARPWPSCLFVTCHQLVSQFTTLPPQVCLSRL